MTQDEIDQLKKINWFSDLPEDFFAALAAKSAHESLATDEVLFHKGDEGDAIFIINSGSVKIVTQDSQDNEVVLNQVGAGEVIGEMALLDWSRVRQALSRWKKLL
jgi:CRP/FNR family transcriptional regulator, cyclic AMP receptor protein